MIEFAKGYTNLALTVFRAWAVLRDTKDGKCPPNLLEEPHPDAEPAKWLSLFILEVCRAYGSKYPPTTIYNILLAFLRHMRDFRPDAPNFLDQKNASFRRLYWTMNLLFHMIRSKGFGAAVKHAVVISTEEAALWKAGVLSTEIPEGLLDAVFFYNGKHFFLRGGALQPTH